MTEQPRKHTRNDAVPAPRPANAARPRPLKSKPVDEDLYKIPPELLYTSKRVGASILPLYLFYN